jgi:MFS family permease
MNKPAPPALVFDPRLLAAAALAAIGCFFVPGSLRAAPIGLAIAVLVLAPLPRGTRGVVVAVMTGLATGQASVNLFAVGLFAGPVTREFGWTQSQYFGVTLVGTLVTTVVALFVGRYFDRDGTRRWALACLPLFGLALVSLYWLTPHVWHFYLVFGLLPFVGAGTSSIAYSRVVTRWFDERRGQAFGAALAGIGIGGAVLSPFTQYLITNVGWRGAYVGLGLLSIFVTLPVVLWKLRDSPAGAGLGMDGRPLAAGDGAAAARLLELTGYDARASRALPRFWLMLGTFLLLAFAIGGVMIPLVPILRTYGITPAQAAIVQGALGLALIAGRAFAGFLMDRFFAPYVAAAIILFPIAGVTLLAAGAPGGSAVIAAICIGIAAGAELDVIAVLTTRYFGTRAYAENYGWLYAAWTLGAGMAPLVTSQVFDRTGSYAPVLWAYAAVFALTGVLVARLGPYPRLP